MRGFRCLEQLELPLELALCHATTIEHWSAMLSKGLSNDPTDHELEYCEPFIGDLVPASISLLWLVSDCTDGYVKVLDVMFRQFAAKKDSQLPALRKIYLTCSGYATEAYKNRCAGLLEELQETVTLELNLSG